MRKYVFPRFFTLAMLGLLIISCAITPRYSSASLAEPRTATTRTASDSQGEIAASGSTAHEQAGGVGAAPSASSEQAQRPAVRSEIGQMSLVAAREGVRQEKSVVRPDPVDTVMSRLSLAQKVGQLLIIAVADPRSHHELTKVDAQYLDLFRRVQPGGVILFGDNMETVPQTIELIQSLQALSSIPLFVATDEEGGAVSRLTYSGNIPATRIPSAQTIGETKDPLLAYDAGKVIGQEMRALGFNMDLAPVADVLTNPKNHVIGSRSFGSDPRLVAQMVAQMVHGLQAAGIGAVLKHFPGHGDTASDTHRSAAVVSYGLSRLKAVELVPFQSGIAAGADGVMIAHIEYPNITDSVIPASLSPGIVSDLLRKNLGYDGVVMTDAMNMAAVTRFTSSGAAAVDALNAGCDIVLMPPGARRVYETLIEAVLKGVIPAERIDQSVRRVLSLKRRLNILTGVPITSVASAEAILASPDNRAVAERILAAAARASASR